MTPLGIARFLAQIFARHVVLLARNPPTMQKEKGRTRLGVFNIG